MHGSCWGLCVLLICLGWTDCLIDGSRITTVRNVPVKAVTCEHDPVDNGLVRFHVCLKPENLMDRALVKFDRFSIWCMSAPAGPNKGRGCYSCSLPAAEFFHSTSLESSKLHIVSSEDGERYYSAILEKTFACKELQDARAQKSTHALKLHSSFLINDVEKDLIVRGDEIVEAAVQRFVDSINMGSEENVYKTLVHEVNAQIAIKYSRREALRKRVSVAKTNGLPFHIVIGAAMHQIEDPRQFFAPNQIPFSVNDLNILDVEDFRFYFGGPSSVDSIMAEHVFEHLDIEQSLQGFKNCYSFLKGNGKSFLRVAVPDWDRYPENTTAKKYFDDIRDKHHVQYNLDSLSALLKRGGLFETVIPREYNAGHREFYGGMDPRFGMVQRSWCFDKRGVFSLVVDAVKGKEEVGVGTSGDTVIEIDQGSGPSHIKFKGGVEFSPNGLNRVPKIKWSPFSSFQKTEQQQNLEKALAKDLCSVENLHAYGTSLAENKKTLDWSFWFFQLALKVFKRKKGVYATGSIAEMDILQSFKSLQQQRIEN
jgi:hypothetical protein